MRSPTLKTQSQLLVEPELASVGTNSSSESWQTIPDEDEGLHLLYQREGKHAPEVDIVAIHGLGGHAFRTWTDTNGKLWLRDFLPQKIPRSRIFTFGYNSAFVFSRSVAGLNDFAVNLLGRLRWKRTGVEEVNRPLIFICHSLGGIVCKRALALAHEDPLYKTVRDGTKGIMFMGTPHMGSALAEWPKLITPLLNAGLFPFRTKIRGELLRMLTERSEVLSDVAKAFLPLSSNLIIVSCYEQKTMTGSGVLVVKSESATLGIPNERTIPIDADHRGIARFSDVNSEKFTPVWEALCEMVTFNSAENDYVIVEKEPPQESNVHVPFMRNDTFTGRKPILDRLAEVLTPRDGFQPRAVLFGLGGIGKTQIAIEYAYQVRGKQVFWVNGDSDDTFAAGYREIATIASLKTADENATTVCSSVKAWLESGIGGDWLLIVDNFDDINMPSRKWLPTQRGSILFTSRNKRAAHELKNPQSGIPVPQMTDDEAYKTFQTLSGLQLDEKETEAAHQLLKMLDNFSLAIAQTASYIRETEITVSEYLQQFMSRDGEQEDLLSRITSRHTDSPDYQPRAAVNVWLVTVAQIEKQSSTSIKLLELMSLLDTDSIPKSLLRAGGILELDSTTKFDQAMSLLLNYSFVSKISDSAFRVHALVALWTRTSMETEPRRDRISEAIKMLHKTYPEGNHENSASCSLLSSHATSAIRYARSVDMHTREYRDLALRLAQYFRYRGSFLSAQDLAEDSLQVAHKLGLDDQEISENECVLAKVRESQGQYNDALKLYQNVYSKRKTVLGADDHKTLRATRDIGEVFIYKGQYRDAIDYLTRALKGLESKLGLIHRDTLETVHAMGIVYVNLEKYDTAFEWFTRSKKGLTDVLGPEHDETLDTCEALAVTLQQRGFFEDAIKESDMAINGKTKVLGEDHPKTMTSLRLRASILSNQAALLGDDSKLYADALGWCEKALDRQSRILGNEHPDTLLTLGMKAQILTRVHSPGDALELFKEVLEGEKKLLGPEHPNTLVTLHNLAQAYQRHEEPEQALSCFTQTLEGQIKTLGMDSRHTLATMHNIGEIHKEQKRYEDALVWFRRSLEGAEVVLGMQHRDTLIVLFSIGETLQDQENLAEALVYYERVADGRRVVLGVDNPYTLVAIEATASVLVKLQRREEALKLLLEVKEAQARIYGPEAAEPLVTTYAIANCYEQLGNLNQALSWYQTLLDGEIKLHGINNWETLYTLHAIGKVHQSQEQHAEALTAYERALAGRREILGDDHQETLLSMYQSALMLEKLGNLGQALERYKMTLEGEKKVYGKKNDNTKVTKSDIERVKASLARQLEESLASQLEESLARQLEEAKNEGPKKPTFLRGKLGKVFPGVFRSRRKEG